MGGHMHIPSKGSVHVPSFRVPKAGTRAPRASRSLVRRSCSSAVSSRSDVRFGLSWQACLPAQHSSKPDSCRHERGCDEAAASANGLELRDWHLISST